MTSAFRRATIWPGQLRSAAIGVVLFAALVTFTWYFTATLFLIFTGMLMAVALNAMTNRLGRLIRLPHALRLAMVCVALAALFSGVVFLGGTTMAQQATALSDTIKSQLVNVKAFLDSHGIDTSYFELASGSASEGAASGATPAGASHLPGAGALASSGGVIVSQTFKLLLGTISAVGNLFIVMFLGLAFAPQPAVYRSGLLFITPARQRARSRRS
jgi:predicted PurR-regulated permease PerM